MKTTKESSGLEEVIYMGFGFCLMERRVLEEMEEPRFLHTWIPGKDGKPGTYSTEDTVFFAKSQYPCYVDHDASKLVWHAGNINYTWADDFSEHHKIFKK